MVVSEKLVFEAAAFLDFTKGVHQRVLLVHSSAECVLDAAGAAVRDDVVYIPASFVQRFYCGLIFSCTG